MAKPVLLCVMIVLVTWTLSWSSRAEAACPPGKRTKADLLELKGSGFVVADPKQRHALASELVDCLANADPVVRDGIAYEALLGWMRDKLLDGPTLHAIEQRLLAQLELRSADKAGFRQPFAALVLASAVAADREKSYLSDVEYAELVDGAADYFESIRDYRGFDERTGWRHAIAHTADLLTQLAVHPRTTRGQVDRIVGALAKQVAPPGHFYIYGEPERVALPLIYIAQRNLYSAEQWKDWFIGIAAVPENGSLYDSQDGLSRRHNVQALLLVLYVNISESKDESLRATLLPPVLETLRLLD